MYRIGLCDDEAVFSASLSSMVDNILKALRIPYTVDVFSSCDALFDVVRDKPDYYQTLLLDIMMSGMNGMELARHIRNQNGKATIVFITSTPDFALQGYEVHAFHYLLKPVSQNDLQAVLEQDYHRAAQQTFLTVRDGTVFRQLDIDGICCLETQGRKVAVFMDDQTIMASAKLSKLEDQLPKNRFVRCHQSFIININRVYELRYGEAVLTDGKVIPVSRSYLQTVQQAFLAKLADR